MSEIYLVQSRNVKTEIRTYGVLQSERREAMIFKWVELAILTTSTIINLVSISFLYRSRNKFKESNAPMLLPNGKILVKRGTKIEQANLGVVEWS